MQIREFTDVFFNKASQVRDRYSSARAPPLTDVHP